jgi:hypothetical protein
MFCKRIGDFASQINARRGHSCDFQIRTAHPFLGASQFANFVLFSLSREAFDADRLGLEN